MSRELITQPSDLPKPRLEWTTKVDMEWSGAAGVIFVVFIVPADLEEKKKYLETILVA